MEDYNEKCFKIMNEKGQTMTPNGSWWYDEWSPSWKTQNDEVKYDTETYYTDTVKNCLLYTSDAADDP